MKKLNIYIAYIVVSVCFTYICLSCTKDSHSETLNSVNEDLNGDSDGDLGEDLSFVRIKSQTTKSFHDNNQYTNEYNAVYDGKKIITEETYMSGKLSSCSTYEYEGLVRIGKTDNYDINTGNKTSTCISNIEYLDNTYLRIKSNKQTTKSFHDNNQYTYEYNAIYDGKKIITEETYMSGKLSSCSTYEYEGLVRIGKTDNYDINTGNKTSTCISNIEYLDNTYLRIKSNKQTTKSFHDNNQYTYEYNAIYDGKKIITEETYLSGKLSSCSSYKYNGLSCTIKTITYDINIGNVSLIIESYVEYLD